MTNEKLKEIKERLLTENDKRRRLEQEQANACANYYERGVNDALTAVSFARPEQQNQPASSEWLNIDEDYTFAACSICKTEYEVATEEEAEKGLWDAFMCSYRYCPSCGAKMDGGGTNGADH